MAGERRSSSRDAASCCCVLALLLVLAVGSLAGVGEEHGSGSTLVVRGPRLRPARPCEEIYVVGEGETLHSISARCGDPFILERNPHIHDPDDVFPGLVIRITPPPAGTNHADGTK